MVAARRVLIVEDEHIVQLHLRMILQPMATDGRARSSIASKRFWSPAATP